MALRLSFGLWLDFVQIIQVDFDDIFAYGAGISRVLKRFPNEVDLSQESGTYLALNDLPYRLLLIRSWLKQFRVEPLVDWHFLLDCPKQDKRTIGVYILVPALNL